MGLKMRKIELECADPLGLGGFWEAALGAPMGPGVDGVRIAPDGEAGFSLYLVEQRAAEHPRSRTRLWLNPVDGRLQDEVDRLTGLGATVVSRCWTNESTGLEVVVLADPEGHEFCVESSDQEVAEAVRRFEDESDDLDGLGPEEPETSTVIRIEAP
ncbi:VOC family protein [Streptomyces angustmyceticus]|uniref:VOC family protein n=1 Tax=Streptomyces angustmyceticus TaxID=285578 RepID=UPI003820B071